MNRFRKENRPSETKKTEASPPLREFVDDLQADPPPPPRSRLSLVLGLLSLVLIVLAGAAVFLITNPFAETEGGAEEVVVRKDFSSGTNEVNVSQLLNAYLEAIGGREVLRQIRSVRYHGRLTSPTGEYDFLGLILIPDKGMLVTNLDGGGSVKLMLNGDVAWQILEQRDGERKVLPLEEKATKSLQWSLRVHNSFRSLAMQGQYSGMSVEETIYMDKPCYEVTKIDEGGIQLKAILDKETFYLLRTEESLGMGDEVNDFAVVYEDHRHVSGIVEPHTTKLYRNGELDNEAVISSYRINQGLVSSLFEIPEELGE